MTRPPPTRGGGFSRHLAPAHRYHGYTLVEMFLTVAVLMMVLGLAVNLSTRLRTDALDRRAYAQLRRLVAAAAAYADAHAGQPPAVAPLVDPAVPDPPESALQSAATRNRDDLRRALGWPAPRPGDADPLTDPWGTPLAFMPAQQPLVGLAPGDRPFAVSAGPDRQFKTRADNLYSYDPGGPEAEPPPTTPTDSRPF